MQTLDRVTTSSSLNPAVSTSRPSTTVRREVKRASSSSAYLVLLVLERVSEERRKEMAVMAGPRTRGSEFLRKTLVRSSQRVS